MFRRHFLTLCAGLGCCLGWLVVGWRRRPSAVDVRDGATPRPTGLSAAESDVAHLVRDRIRKHLPNTTRFDPMTLLLIVGFVLRVLQICQAAAILRQQLIVKRRPAGSLVARMKRRLHDEFATANPDQSDESIEEHLAAAITAFAQATPDELRDVKSILDRGNRSPTPVELFELTEELSVELPQ